MTTKKELVEFYSNYNGINSKEAEIKIDYFLKAVIKALSENETVVFRKFGSFEVRKTKEVKIHDPKNSENIIHAKPRKYIKFKVSRGYETELYEEK